MSSELVDHVFEGKLFDQVITEITEKEKKLLDEEFFDYCDDYYEVAIHTTIDESFSSLISSDELIFNIFCIYI